MAEMFLNVELSGAGSSSSSRPAEQGNHKHKRFLQRRKFLERRGFLKEKQLPPRPPGKKAELRPSRWDQVRHNGQQEAHSNHAQRAETPSFLQHQQGAPSRTVNMGAAGQSLTVDLASNHSNVKMFTSKPSGGGGATTGGPGPAPTAKDAAAVPSLQPQNVSLLSEFESGLAPAPSYKVVAIDCEMVGTGLKGSVSALARCSIIGYHGDVVYDKYVRPASPVTDYRTKWSGIRREHLYGATPFATAQKEIVKILHGKLVIGHAIHNDYKALGYVHPKEMTRDTARIPLLNRKAGLPEKDMASLKRLAKQLLRKDIQTGRYGHSSVEDARTTMELYRMVEAEYERELASCPPAT